ncbi:MAG: hypothetical protein AAF202_02015, partial [Pseudomonadota bacterium]
PEKKKFVRTLAESLVRAEGRNRSLAFAMIFSLKSQSGSQLSEEEILKALVTYGYGVPGIKFAQYLAFTSDFRKVFADLQDQAMPISYMAAVEILEKEFPGGLPYGMQILSIKGSGSVNIGIEYYNPMTNDIEILSVPREGIEAATREDFRRLRLALLEVTQDEEGMRLFGFMLGLLDTVEASVQLEFNRQQVFENQQALAKILNRRALGWNVKMVEAYELLNGRFIRMQMAKGRPARLVQEEKPNLYKSAMRAASQVMVDHLMRWQKSPTGKYYADSDFHNGQVFIDEETKTVWLIDPGQSIEISVEDYELAKWILKILSNTVPVDVALNWLNDSTLNPEGQEDFYLKEELSVLMESEDKSDAFIRFISLTKSKGSDVPLPTVQWVLGMNRQVAVGNLIGSNTRRRLWSSGAAEAGRNFLSNPSSGRFSEFWTVFRALWQ